MTERRPGRNHDTNVQTCHCIRPLRLALLANSPKGEAKGRLRRRGRTVLPFALGGLARPLALPMGELARRSRD